MTKDEVLLVAARNVIAAMFDHYKARNGRMCSIEGDDGEKCWIVPFEAMGDLILAVENAPTPSSADNALREALEAGCVVLEGRGTGLYDEALDSIGLMPAALAPSPAAEAEPVNQFRRAGCSDWYDGLPDHEDGKGPYETRTLYAAPVSPTPVEAGALREKEICPYCNGCGEHDASGSPCAVCNGSGGIDPDEEAYEMGRRDGYEQAIADVDRCTGGDGEYFASTIPGQGCPDWQSMVAKIVDRFTALSQPGSKER
ncbi:hypothetical protein [Sphingobium sp. CFD-1]|uniref:hypothetical protein n=1 Tax=Sphingobium sp. CFD-1 TaxID=2878545 RepID=UPI00214C838F|nr:hypothetical protein [Sphingobium sp. CFD-1]